MSFRDQLAVWVERSGLSGSAIQRAVNKGGGYISRVIKGDLPPPDRATCAALGELFVERGVMRDASTVWRLAAPERLLALDPDLAEWADALHAGATGLWPREARLLRLMLSAHMVPALSVLMDALDESGREELAALLSGLANLPPEAAPDALRVLRSVVGAWPRDAREAA